MNDENSAIRHILVAHDFSETAERALGFALDLAGKLGARVTIMHAYEIVSYAMPEGLALTAQTMGEIEGASEAALDAVAKRSQRPGVEVTVALRQGPAWTEIVAFAEEAGANLIVMGTHGRRGLSRLFLGSVAERVVRTSPCPVLTVRGPESPK